MAEPRLTCTICGAPATFFSTDTEEFDNLETGWKGFVVTARHARCEAHRRDGRTVFRVTHNQIP